MCKKGSGGLLISYYVAYIHQIEFLEILWNLKLARVDHTLQPSRKEIVRLLLPLLSAYEGIPASCSPQLMVLFFFPQVSIVTCYFRDDLSHKLQKVTSCPIEPWQVTGLGTWDFCPFIHPWCRPDRTLVCNSIRAKSNGSLRLLKSKPHRGVVLTMKDGPPNTMGKNTDEAKGMVWLFGFSLDFQDRWFFGFPSGVFFQKFLSRQQWKENFLKKIIIIINTEQQVKICSLDPCPPSVGFCWASSVVRHDQLRPQTKLRAHGQVSDKPERIGVQKQGATNGLIICT